MDYPTGKMLAWPLKHDSSRCHRDSVRGRNSCPQYVCVVRCSNVTIIRNISSNIPTKLTEFINRNCTQDAIKSIYKLSEPNIFSGDIPRTPLREGKLPPLVLPPARAFGTRGRFRRSMAGPLFKSRRQP